MAFWGCSFVFDGIPCEEYDLMLYDSFSGKSQDEGKFSNTVKIIEDKVSTRWKPHFYGAIQEDKLELSLIFGVNQNRLDLGKPLDRDELNAIALWLVGHNEYKWLEILQEDIEHVRYRCIITELEIIEYGTVPWALKATLECDSPYGYMHPRVFEYVVNGYKDVRLLNESGHPGYYKPRIEVDLHGTGTFSITNVSDNNHKLELKDVPGVVNTITIDNDYCIITDVENGINLYPYFNFNFFRLVRGVNQLHFEGDCTVRIICEFPVNTGS